MKTEMSIADILALDMRHVIFLENQLCLRPGALEDERERIVNKTSILSRSQRDRISGDVCRYVPKENPDEKGL